MEQGLISNIWPALSPSRPVFRACRNSSERDKRAGTAKAKLFFRRADETGLSVGLSAERAIRDIKPEGLFEIGVSDVRSSEDPLHFAQDEVEHAEIQGMPLLKDDEERALRIANYLVRYAQKCLYNVSPEGARPRPTGN
jgi:hypothetical protein